MPGSPLDEDEYGLQNDPNPHQAPDPDEAPEPSPAPEPMRQTVFDRLAQVRQEVAAPLPRWTFFSGVFGFPWHRSVVMRWGYLSLGCTVIVFVASVMYGLYAQMGGPFGMAMAFFALPMFWLLMWTLSYAASCGLQVLDDTASGNQEVHEWPDPNWHEWAWKLYYTGFLMSVAVVAAYAVARLLELAGVLLPISMPLLIVLFYPVVLMSAFYENSMWAVCSPALLLRLIRMAHFTALFYLLAGGVWIVVGLFSMVSLRYTMFGALAAGPALAAAFLITPRLMGRLLWRLQFRPRKKLKKAVTPDAKPQSHRKKPHRS